MTTASTTHRRVLTDAIPGDRVRDVLLSVGFALAIALSTQLKFGGEVPLTGQTFAVLAGALALGRSRATAGSLLYLALGVAGVPWFSGAGTHTIGYIVGFVLASVALGTYARVVGSRRPLHVVGAMVVGNLVIWACGAAGLLAVLPSVTTVSQAVAVGVTPFLLGDAIKLVAAAAVLPALWRLVDRTAR